MLAVRHRRPLPDPAVPAEPVDRVAAGDGHAEAAADGAAVREVPGARGEGELPIDRVPIGYIAPREPVGQVGHAGTAWMLMFHILTETYYKETIAMHETWIEKCGLFKKHLRLGRNWRHEKTLKFCGE